MNSSAKLQHFSVPPNVLTVFLQYFFSPSLPENQKALCITAIYIDMGEVLTCPAFCQIRDLRV